MIDSPSFIGLHVTAGWTTSMARSGPTHRPEHSPPACKACRLAAAARGYCAAAGVQPARTTSLRYSSWCVRRAVRWTRTSGRWSLRAAYPAV